MADFGNVERTDEDFIDLSVNYEDCNITNNCDTSTKEHPYSINCDNNPLANDGMEYLAGFVCHKTKQIVAEEFNSNSWVGKVSEGGLKIPDKEAEAAVLHLEKIFKSTNGLNICDKPGILKRMLNRAEEVQIGLKFKKLYLRSRLYFRIRYLNRLSDLNLREKRKLRMSKIKKTIK